MFHGFAKRMSLMFSKDKVDVSNSANVGVIGPLTDSQLRSSPVPVSLGATPLPSGAATEATLAAIQALINATNGYVDGLEPALSLLNAKDFATQTTLSQVKLDTAKLDITLTALRDALRGSSSKTLTDLDTDLVNLSTLLGALNETTPGSDTSSAGLNARLQRVAQNITTMITGLTAGTYKIVNRGAAKGSTVAADITSTAASADRQLMDVIVRDASGAVATFLSTQYSELATTSPATGNAVLNRYKSTDPTLTSDQMYIPSLNIRGERRVFNAPWRNSYTFTVAGGLNQTVEVNTEGCSMLSVQTVSSSWTGSGLTLQGTIDGTTWIAIGSSNISALYNTQNGAALQIISAGTSGIMKGDVSTFSKVRLINLSALVSGSVAVTMMATNAVGNHMVVQSANATTYPLQVNITGSSAANIMKLEDAAHASGDAGVAFWGVRQDSLSIPTSASGDYGFLSLSQYGSLIVKQEERHKPTYTASFIVRPASAATDIAIISAGTKTIALTKMTIAGYQDIASNVDFYIIKRSADNIGGTRTLVDIVTHNAADSAAIGKVYNYTVNPSSLGAAIAGYLKIFRLYVNDITKEITEMVIDWGDNNKPPELRANTSDSIGINLNGITVTGARIYITLTFTEI